MNRSASVIALVAVLLSLGAVLATHAAAAGCPVDAHGRPIGILVNGHCINSGPNAQRRSASAPRTKDVFCGQPASHGTGEWNPQCGRPQTCLIEDKASRKAVPTNAFATVTLVHGRWTNPVVWCPAQAAPAPTLADIRDRALRLLPPVSIGAAWSTTTLVNAETVLWAATAPDRDLGTVTVVGQRVRLRISFVRAHWDFGDGATDTTTTPGKAYDEAGDPCRTAQCPDYYGHTYRTTGPRTVRLSVDWHAQYDVGTGWADISGDLTGPSATHRLIVKQARGVLVPNPGDH